MELSVVVPAPIAEVWKMYVTEQGFSSWAAPFAKIDLRVGGFFETSYKIDSIAGEPNNIKNQIVSFVPERLIVIRNTQAPPNTPFDVPTFQQLHTALSFVAVGAKETRVTLQNAGYRDGEKFDGVYKFFKAGNNWTLDQFRNRFLSGPTAWDRPAGAPAASNSKQ